MTIIGHEEIEFSPFYWIKNVNDIKNTPPNSVVIFSKDDNYSLMMNHCKKNNITFANEVKSINQALISSANNASFLVVSDMYLAKKLQDIANNYLFDAKIILRIKSDEELENAAISNIDGVIFPNGEILNG